jgi:lysophospholipase L1-like esterase
MGSNVPSTFADQTVRMIVRASLGGNRVRIALSNMFNAQPLEIGAAHIAVHKADGAIAEGTDRALTFGGKSSFTIQPGVLAVSDPADLEVAPLSDLAVSLYLPRDTGAPATHMIGLRTAYISKGDVTGSATMPEPATMSSYVWLSCVEVAAPADALTVVALGDSITDGFSTTRDAERAWPALLARRLQANKGTRHVAVVNQGISGNQVLRDGAGLSALARFDRDVLSRPGVRWVILLEGINDINIRGRTDGPNALTAEELIWGYKQIIARCHAHSIRVVGATIMPEEGVFLASERGEAIRQTVNQWIRAKGNFDAVVDFDAVVRDPQRPIRIRPEFDPGDHIHPNDAGNQAMANAFDLRLFRK